MNSIAHKKPIKNTIKKTIKQLGTASKLTFGPGGKWNEALKPHPWT
jgi:hypothetical protein